MLTRRLAAHPRRVLALVFLFVLVAGAVGGSVASRLDSSGGFVAPGADSERAVEQIEEATGRSASPDLVVLVRDGTRVTSVEERLGALPGVAATAVADPVPDGAVVTATVEASLEEEDVAEEAIDAFADDDAVVVGGPAVVGMQIGERVGRDLGRAELIAFPLLLLLSILFFRGRATLLPLAVGVTTVMGTFLVLSLIDAVVFGMNIFALNLVIGLGLGLGIDYTLFLVTRFREELARGRDVGEAIAVTMGSAGRSVAFSAATVAAALITLTVFPQQFLKSMGIAGATVAIVGALAALVLSPALFALWGRKLARPASGDDGSRWWRVAHWVMRRPAPVAIVTAALMVGLAIPALSTTWTPIDSTVIPKDLSARVVADALNEGDGAGRSPAPVVYDGPDVGALVADVRDIDGVVAVTEPQQLGEMRWAFGVVADGDPAGDVARGVVEDLRDRDLLVGGSAAEFLDQQAALAERLPLAIVLLCGLTFVVLFLMTGSLVLPLKAILMNALTVGAALFPLTVIYGGGHLTGLLGYTPNGGVEPSDFLVTAATVFALSTDYGVFLLARIKELRDGGMDDREAVATGLARTGRVVTAAAILLAVAIGAFSTSSISFIQQIGVATATGVLIDAFVVRTFLVPSLMTLLGKWNWWAPAPLKRLHSRIAFAG